MDNAYVDYKTAKKIARECACQPQTLEVVKEQGELLLRTGAKLVFNRFQRWWYVSGYADNGCDVYMVLRYVTD